MQSAAIVLNQIILMFILSAIGYYLYRRQYITKEGVRSIGNILIHLILPCVIVKGFLVERDPEHMTGLLISGIAGAGCVLLSILVSRLIFRKDPIACFAASFSNPGFFGVPLVVAAFSDGAVFYMASYIAAINIGQFTYGVALMTGSRDSIRPKAIVKAPFFLATAVGLLLFFLGVPIPQMGLNVLSSITAANTPLAMFTIGCYMAAADLPAIFRKKELYLVSAVRLIVVPFLTMISLMLIPDRFAVIQSVLLITACCPVGSNVAVYAQLHDKDYGYAVGTVVVSTLLSVITIPAFVYLHQLTG